MIIVIPQSNIRPHRLPGQRGYHRIRRCQCSYIIDLSPTQFCQSKWATKIEEFSDLTVFAISDVRLDNERAMEGLQKMFQSCVSGDFIPKVFILCGNFSSKNVTTDLEMDAYRGLSLPLLVWPGTVLTCVADNFTALGDLIVSFPRINHYSHFLFIPGPNDPWSSDLLPRRPIPSTFTQRLSNKIAHAVFGSNPCRIKFMGQEIVVFREDLMAKMVRNLVGVKPDLESADLKKYVRLALNFQYGPVTDSPE